MTAEKARKSSIPLLWSPFRGLWKTLSQWLMMTRETPCHLINSRGSCDSGVLKRIRICLLSQIRRNSCQIQRWQPSHISGNNWHPSVIQVKAGCFKCYVQYATKVNFENIWYLFVGHYDTLKQCKFWLLSIHPWAFVATPYSTRERKWLDFGYCYLL